MSEKKEIVRPTIEVVAYSSIENNMPPGNWSLLTQDEKERRREEIGRYRNY